MVNTMGGIVLELQNEIVSSNCDVVNILRKAHLIASKLKLADFDQWIQHELMVILTKNLVLSIEKFMEV